MGLEIRAADIERQRRIRLTAPQHRFDDRKCAGGVFVQFGLGPLLAQPVYVLISAFNPEKCQIAYPALCDCDKGFAKWCRMDGIFDLQSFPTSFVISGGDRLQLDKMIVQA